MIFLPSASQVQGLQEASKAEDKAEEGGTSAADPGTDAGGRLGLSQKRKNKEISPLCKGNGQTR
jgi:hypothetical protein